MEQMPRWMRTGEKTADRTSGPVRGTFMFDVRTVCVFPGMHRKPDPVQQFAPFFCSGTLIPPEATASNHNHDRVEERV